MITFADCWFRYTDRQILAGINLSVAAGECVAVMGQNGCGKSTLLQAAAGLIPLQQGRIVMHGLERRSNVATEHQLRRSSCYLPANTWLPGGLSGREYLAGVGELYERTAQDISRCSAALLTAFHLEANQVTDALSTGQQKKLALCGALISDADCYILDEPFAGGLDPAGILTLQHVMQELAARSDVTILFATPVPQIVGQLAHRVAVLHEGVILACDTVPALCARYSATDLAEVMSHITPPDDAVALAELIP